MRRLTVFQNTPKQLYGDLRRTIIDLVLGTDMGKHFEEVARLTTKVSVLIDCGDDSDDEGERAGNKYDVRSGRACRQSGLRRPRHDG